MTETQEIMAIWEALGARDAREERFLRQLRADLGLPRNTDICLPVRPGVYPGERTRTALEIYVLTRPVLALDCYDGTPGRHYVRGAQRVEDIPPLTSTRGPNNEPINFRRWLRKPGEETAHGA